MKESSDEIALDTTDAGLADRRERALWRGNRARQGMLEGQFPRSNGRRRFDPRAQWLGPSPGDGAAGQRLRCRALRHENLDRFGGDSRRTSPEAARPALRARRGTV